MRSFIARRDLTAVGAAALITFLFQGCCTDHVDDIDIGVLRRHMVAFLPDGRAFDPDSLVKDSDDQTRAMNDKEYEAYLERITETYGLWSSYGHLRDLSAWELFDKVAKLAEMWGKSVEKVGGGGGGRKPQKRCSKAFRDCAYELRAWVKIRRDTAEEEAGAKVGEAGVTCADLNKTYPGYCDVLIAHKDLEDIATRVEWMKELKNLKHGCECAVRPSMDFDAYRLAPGPVKPMEAIVNMWFRIKLAASAQEEESDNADRATDEADNRRRIFLFIHGGLNCYETTAKCVKSLKQHVQDSNDPAYPIFLAWNSAFFSSYVENLRSEGPFDGSAWKVAAPFQVIKDVALGVWRLVPRGLTTLVDGAEQVASCFGYVSEDQKILNDAKSRASDLSSLRIYETKTHCRCDWYRHSNTSLRPLLTPIQWATSFAVDTFGRRAWEGMLQRTDLLFERDDGRKVRRGLSQFVKELRKLKGEYPKTEITLVAHSMGTIVANKIVGDDLVDQITDRSTDGKQALPPLFDEIVYMGAASTIEDLEAAIYLYLEFHPSTHFCQLVLAPAAESSEKTCGDIAPRGSLLVYIDEYLSSPQTVRQRTAGRFSNLVHVLGTKDETIRARIHTRVFGAGSLGRSGLDADARKRYEIATEPWPHSPNDKELDDLFSSTIDHGDFNDRAFWLKDYRAQED